MMQVAAGLALFLLLAALVVLALAARQRRDSGLPGGRVIAADTSGWRRLEKPLYDPQTGLAGKPDYVVESRGVRIPVEVKSGWAPPEPYDSHIYQLAAYCLLVEHDSGVRPPYGILRYRNRTFAIDYTPALEAELREVLDALRKQQKRIPADRSHAEPGRCVRCGYRKQCDQRLA